MTEATLKPGWTKVKFGEVVRLCKDRSSDPEAEGIERYVGLEHLEPEDLRIRRWGLVAEGTTFTSRFKPGQVLFGKRRAYQRKVAVADFEGVCSGDIYVFESADPKHLLPELLPFICQTDQFFDYAIGTSMGSLSPRTNWKSLKDFNLVLPPIEEQENLYSQLFSLEAGIDSYSNAVIASQTNIKSLSISLFSKDWDSSPIKLSRVIEDSRYGPRFSSSLYNEKGSVGQIRTTDMDESGNINYLTVPKADLIAEDYKEHLLKDGDIVISRSGTCGITAIFNSQKIPVIPGAFLIRLRPNEKTYSEYLHEFFSSPLGRQLTASLARGGVQKNISGSQLLEQEVPYPIQERQKEVVSKLDGLKKAERNLQERQLMLQRMKTKFLNTALGGFT